MPKRRANGEGNIRKRKDGRWEGRYTVGRDPETGKAIIKNVRGKTQAGDTVKTELIYDREKVRAESCPDFSYISQSCGRIVYRFVVSLNVKKSGRSSLEEAAMAFDFKKEYKEFYMPKNKPEIVIVPKANYIAVKGKGDPNEEGGAYQQAISVLYAVAYTLKMSYKTDHKIVGFFEYVVPPLEGFWWQDHIAGVDYTDKSAFNWISVIRLPDFITKEDFEWAVDTAAKKKKLDCSSAEFLTIDEGLCVQIMHLGAFDDEPATVALMDAYLKRNGYVNDMNMERLHHEIYLSDARKVAPENGKRLLDIR